jgi:hypothetical protein
VQSLQVYRVFVVDMHCIQIVISALMVQETERFRRDIVIALTNRGKSHTWLAQQLDLNYTALSHMLYGRRKWPEVHLKKLRSLLGVEAPEALTVAAAGR